MAGRKALCCYLLAVGVCDEVVLYRNCHSPRAAYAGAWFARRDTVMETMFGDSLGMEYHDYYMFHQGGNGRPRVVMKSAEASGFFVEHLSKYEHLVKSLPGAEGLLEAQTLRVLGECEAKKQVWPVELGPAPIAVIPFWGGDPEVENGKAVGNSHSHLSRQTKLRHLRGVTCSIQNALPGARLFVAVANPTDLNDVTALFADSPLFAALQVEVEHGVYLAFAAIRELQDRIDSQVWETDFVFFTEADQVLHRRVTLRGLLAALGQHVYVAPNRLYSWTGVKPAIYEDGKTSFLSEDNICFGELLAVEPRRAARAPPHRPALRKRGDRTSWPAQTTPRRQPVNTTETHRAKEQERRHAKTGDDDASYNSTFLRCWDLPEKNGHGWFVHRSAFAAADFFRIKNPIKSLGFLAEQIYNAKRTSSWRIWGLLSMKPSDFATCHLCQGEEARTWMEEHHHHHNSTRRHRQKISKLEQEADCSSDLDAAPSLREAGSIALMPLPRGDMGVSAVASICSALKAGADVVLVGACGNDTLPFEESRLRDKGLLLVERLECLESTEKKGQLDHAAALLLLRHAQRQVDGGQWQVEWLFFAPVGDLVRVDNLEGLKAAASPTAIVISHRYHHSKQIALVPSTCEKSTRDWLTPLSPPNRLKRNADATAYLLIPR